MARSRLIKIEVVFLHETDLAVRVRSEDTGVESWVPKSICEIEKEDTADLFPCAATLEMSDYIAEEKGLI